jgi:hypothetical protein
MSDFTKQHVQNLFAHLKLLNVHHFTIEFEGSGDDVQIDHIQFFTTEDDYLDVPEDTISWVYTELNTTQGEIKPVEQKTTLLKACEDLGYQMLDEAGHDWVNNDGGYGTITVTIDDGTGKPSVNMDIKIRYTDEDQYDYGNESFTMFADEGDYKKTDNRELMDKLLDEIKERA